MAEITNLNVEHSILEKPFESVCGDLAFLIKRDDSVLLGLIDGAGHGPEAQSIAVLAHDFILENQQLELAALMSELHASLQGTRGGVALIGKINLKTHRLSFVGVGNIELRMFGSQTRRFVLTQGVLGSSIRTPQKQSVNIYRGDVFVIHTDGISSFFNLDDYPDLPYDETETIASVLMDKFTKGNDDATALIVRLT